MKRLAILLAVLAFAASIAVGQSTAWEYSTKTAIDGKTTEFAKTESNEATSLVVRCSSKCEVYVHTRLNIVADQASVRVKFNDSPALKRFAVSRGEGSDSLFFRDPISVLRAIRDNGGYMTVEYSPYEKTPTMTKFGIWNLPPTILKRVEVQGAAEDKARKARKLECAAIDKQMSNLAAYSDEWMKLRFKQIEKCPSQ